MFKYLETWAETDIKDDTFVWDNRLYKLRQPENEDEFELLYLAYCNCAFNHDPGLVILVETWFGGGDWQTKKYNGFSLWEIHEKMHQSYLAFSRSMRGLTENEILQGRDEALSMYREQDYENILCEAGFTKEAWTELMSQRENWALETKVHRHLNSLGYFSFDEKLMARESVVWLAITRHKKDLNPAYAPVILDYTVASKTAKETGFFPYTVFYRRDIGSFEIKKGLWAAHPGALGYTFFQCKEDTLPENPFKIEWMALD